MSSQTQTQNKPKKENNFVIVDFIDLDTSKFTFAQPKDNNFGGKYVTVRYASKQLYVRYGTRTCTFGVSTNTQNVQEKQPNTYPKDLKVTGYGTSLTLHKDYVNDSYYEKGRELDEFFINKCIENSMLWGLGGSKTKPIARETIEGYDDKGDNGKWKRLLKYPYKKDKTTNERIYQEEYSPRLDFGIPTVSMVEEKGEDNLLHTKAVFKPRFYDADGSKYDEVSTDNIDEILPAWSRMGVVAMWSSISLGTYGASLKPKAQQMRIFPNEGLDNDQCYLDGEDADADADAEDQFNALPDALGSLTSNKNEVVEEEVVEEDLEEEEELLEDVDDTPVPVKAPVRKGRRIVTKKA